MNGISAQLTALAGKLEERGKTPWAAILAGATFMLSVLLAVGGIVAWGLSTQNSNIVANLDGFKEQYESNRLVSRQDNENRFARIDDYLARSVPREEHQQIWLAQSNTDRDQQRQIDELKTAFGSVYGLRDIINDLKDRQEEISKQLRRSPNAVYDSR